jgi:hypothetical protein
MRISWTISVVAVLLISVGGIACSDSGGSTDGSARPAKAVIDPKDGGRYAPRLDPSDFVGAVTNPLLPLPVGATWTYEGQEAGRTEHVEVHVLPTTRTVMGIPAVAVRDTVTIDGRLTEDTFDWYAQDKAGNVWYLGESTKEYRHGQVSSTAGSWEAGVGGAYPGIIMKATPTVGDAYRQEYLRHEAEDLARVARSGGAAKVPAGSFRNLVAIDEWTPLEPKVVETKYYAAGVGPVLETVQRGGSGRLELLHSSLSE